MQDYPITPDLRVLSILADLCGRHGKLWCFPNGQTIREMLANRFARVMSPRTLWRHLGALERDHYIKRQRRHKATPAGYLELHSTIYTLLRRTIRAMRGLTAYMIVAAGHRWARRWFPPVPKPAQSTPRQGDITGGPSPPEPAPDPNRVSRLRRLMETALKPMPRA